MSGKAIRETLGFLAVVASLIFVGIEIRQNNNLARGQARHALTEIQQEWLLAYSQDAEYHDLFQRMWVESAEVTQREVDRATMMMIGYLRRLENVYFQHREGLVDDSALDGYGVQATEYFESPAFRDFWRSARGNYDRGFVAFFEERLGL